MVVSSETANFFRMVGSRSNAENFYDNLALHLPDSWESLYEAGTLFSRKFFAFRNHDMRSMVFLLKNWEIVV